MTTIQYHESLHDPHHAVDPQPPIFNLSGFSQACGQSQEWILQLVEYDILSDRTESKSERYFSEADLERAQQAYRLQRDFNASFPAVAMMLDLIEEVQQLRREVKHLHIYKH